jgi:hypothetical protein
MLLIVMSEQSITKYLMLQVTTVESLRTLFLTALISFIYLEPILTSFDSSQECFKSSWSSHKSVHLKAKVSSIGTQNSDSLGEGWLYFVKRGQGRTPKLPYFDWTG